MILPGTWMRSSDTVCRLRLKIPYHHLTLHILIDHTIPPLIQMAPI